MLGNHTQCALFYHTESTMLELIKFHSDIPQVTLIGAYLFCQENKRRNCVTYVVIKMAGHKQTFGDVNDGTKILLLCGETF